jgi:hypothetical protein
MENGNESFNGGDFLADLIEHDRTREENKAQWEYVCREIRRRNHYLAPRDQHHIPSWAEWVEHFDPAPEYHSAVADDPYTLAEREAIQAESSADDLAEHYDKQWWPWETGDYLLALRSPGSLAAKTHFFASDGSLERTEGYGGGLYFKRSMSPILRGVEDLSKALVKLERELDWFVVRGEPSDPNAPDLARRKYSDGTFRCVDRSWLMVDIDGLPVPESEDPVEYTIKRLPTYFHNVACHWQFSASHGLKGPGITSLHLWYWLDRPVCCFSLREWAKKIGVDPKVYNPVQPHYTANPVFVGAPDPLTQRSGFRDGEPVLVLPPEVVNLETFEAIEAAKKAEEQRNNERERARAAARKRLNPHADVDLARYCGAALRGACNRIITAPDGSRHDTIFAESASIGSLVNHIDLRDAHLELFAAACVALGPQRRAEAERTVRDGLSVGAKKPKDLSHVGAGKCR